MDTDLFVVVGFLLAALALPSALASYAEGIFPKTALTILVLGTIIALSAAMLSPDGYSFGRIPHSFIEILARIFN
jgi:hypothetical protein